MNLMIKHPKCRYCDQLWAPRLSVVAARAYCRQCLKSRKKVTKGDLALRHISRKDVDGLYLLPKTQRKLRTE
jgi:hypothetical protein